MTARTSLLSISTTRTTLHTFSKWPVAKPEKKSCKLMEFIQLEIDVSGILTKHMTLGLGCTPCNCLWSGSRAYPGGLWGHVHLSREGRGLFCEEKSRHIAVIYVALKVLPSVMHASAPKEQGSNRFKQNSLYLNSMLKMYLITVFKVWTVQALFHRMEFALYNADGLCMHHWWSIQSRAEMNTSNIWTVVCSLVSEYYSC